MTAKRNPTRAVAIGKVTLGGAHPVVVQSMCATKTVNVEATSEQAEQLRRAGAGIVRIAVDSDKDAEAVAEIRNRTEANLSVDLQENYRLAAKVAPLRRQDSLQPRPPLPSRAAEARPGQGGLPGRRRFRERLRDSHRGQLRIHRSREGGGVRARLHRRDGRIRARALGDARRDGFRAILRLTEGFRSGESGRSEPSVRGEATRRAAPSRGHRGRAAAGRHHQDPHRLRATALSGSGRYLESLADPTRILANTRKSRWGSRFSKTSPRAAFAPSRSSPTTGSTSSPVHPARASRTKSSSSSPRK